MSHNLRTLIIELNIQATSTSEDEILNILFQGLKKTHGEKFVSTIDTVELEEEESTGEIRTLILELDVEQNEISDSSILQTIHQSLEQKYGAEFVSSIDTVQAEEEEEE